MSDPVSLNSINPRTRANTISERAGYSSQIHRVSRGWATRLLFGYFFGKITSEQIANVVRSALQFRFRGSAASEKFVDLSQSSAREWYDAGSSEN